MGNGDVGCRLRGGFALKRVLGVGIEGEVLSGEHLQRIGECIQSAVARNGDGFLARAHGEGDFCVNAVRCIGVLGFQDGEGSLEIDEVTAEDFVDLLRKELTVLGVGDVLDVIAEDLAHLGGEDVIVLCFEDVSDTALARLRIDTDDVGLIDTTDIGGVDGEVGDVPGFEILFRSPLHALGDCILMRPAEGGEDELAAVRLTLIDAHAGDLFVDLGDGGEIREIKPRVDTLREEIEGEGDDIDVAGALPVAEEGALDAVAACEKSHFAVRNGASAVVVGVEGNDDVFAVLQVFVHVFDLCSIDMGHGMRDGDGEVDDDLIVRSRIPDVENGVGDLKCELGLGTREAFGGILEGDMTLGGRLILLTKLCAEDGDLDDFFEITSDYITYSDNYSYASSSEEVSITFANDDIGIEIDSFNPEKLLDVLCAAGKSLSMHGNIFDIDDEEYYFVSHKNDASYVNTDSLEFADELDEEARREEDEEADDYE